MGDLEIDYQSNNQFKIHIEVVVDRASGYDNDLRNDHWCAGFWVIGGSIIKTGS